MLSVAHYSCVDAKDNNLPLVLLHGWGNDSRVWREVLPLFQQHSEVITLDLPGFGQSSGRTTWQQAVDLLAEGLPPRCHLLGWSLGGMLAVRLAHQLPKRVASLIQIASNASFVRRDGWPNAMAGDVFERFYQSFNDNPDTCLRQFCALQAKGDRRERAVLRWLRNNSSSILPGSDQKQDWLQSLAWLGELDNRALLPDLAMPCLFLFGEADQLVPVAAAQDIAALCPKTEVKLLQGIGHAPQISAPETVAAICREFLSLSRSPLSCSYAPRGNGRDVGQSAVHSHAERGNEDGRGSESSRLSRSQATRVNEDAEGGHGEDSGADPYFIDKRQLAASFGRAAASYDSVAHLQRQVGERLLAKVQVDFSGAMADMGCGTGYFTRQLQARFGGQCVGVDIAPGMVQFAQQQSPLGECENSPQWLCADAEATAIAAGSFDLIFSNFAFQWSQNLPVLMAEQFRLLRPGGLLLFTTVGPGSLGELRRAWQAVDDHVHVNRFAHLTAVRAAVEAAGFQLQEWLVETEVRHYPQLSDLTRELKALGAHNLNRGRNNALTGRKHIATLKAAYESQRQPQGLPASWEILYAVARK